MREWNASLRVYLDVAKAAVDNAESKASQARILFDLGHHGTAAALAIIGQEETGKALLYALIGFAVVPEDAIPAAMKLVNDHGRKQQLAMVGHVLAQVAPKLRRYVDELPDKLEVSEQVLRPLLSALVPVVLDQVTTFLAERPDFEERLAQPTFHRALQDLKHRGLYVDFRDEMILDPLTVAAAEAAAALADLDASVEGIRMFTQIVSFSDEGVRLTRSALDPHLELAEKSDLHRLDSRG